MATASEPVEPATDVEDRMQREFEKLANEWRDAVAIEEARSLLMARHNAGE